MRREKIQEAIAKVQTDIRSSGIISMLDKAIEQSRSGTKEKNDWFSLSPFKRLTISQSIYSDAENRILEIFDLEILSELEFWESLSEGQDLGLIYTTSGRIRFLMEHSPKILKLLEQEHVSDVKTKSSDLPKELANKELITITLSEEEGQFSSTKRIISALDGLNKIYAGLSEFYGEEYEELILLACDSGSDKSFDILGIASGIEKLRGVITDIWDRVVFHRHNQHEASISLIASTLPIVQKVDDLVTSGSMDRVQGELLKRKLLDGGIKFLESGAITSDMEKNSLFNPRLLMKAEQKLLSGPAPSEAISKAEENIDLDSIEIDDAFEDNSPLSLDEIEQMRNLVRRAERNPEIKPRPPRRRVVRKKTD